MNNNNIAQNVIKAYNLIKNEKPLYHITINPKSVLHIKDLRFKTSCYLRTIMKTFDYGFKPIKYLFVIEYSEAVSNGFNDDIERLGEHVHLLISSNIDLQRLEALFYVCWQGVSNTKFERIDDRNDLNEFHGYLTKQQKSFTEDNFRTNLLKKNN
jgi:hypothetical protein